MKKTVFSLLVCIVNSTFPWDDPSFELFPDWTDPNGTVADSLVPPPTPVVDWCFEYDEIRFLIDITTFEIPATEKHLHLINKTIDSIVRFINNSVFPPSMRRMNLTSVDSVANWAFEKEPDLGPYKRFLESLAIPFLIHKKGGVGKCFRDIVLQTPRLGNRDLAILLARLIRGLILVKEKNLRDLELSKKKKNDLIETVQLNRKNISRCLENRITTIESTVGILQMKLDFVKTFSERFDLVRKIITDEIREHSRIFIEAPAELKLKCMASARLVMFGKGGIKPVIDRSLPRKLMRALNVKNWSFLVTWVKALDDLENLFRVRSTHDSEEIQSQLLFLQNTLLQNKSLLTSLENDCREAQ